MSARCQFPGVWLCLAILSLPFLQGSRVSVSSETKGHNQQRSNLVQEAASNDISSWTPQKFDLTFDRTMNDILVMQTVRRTFPATNLERHPPVGVKKKIGYLFLVKDGFDQNDLWQTFFNGADPGSYAIYVHQWNPGSDAAAAARAQWGKLGAEFIPTVKTGWGQLAGAEFALLWESLRDPAIAQFALASEGTVPLKSAKYINSYLLWAPSESKICFNKAENEFSIVNNERHSSCVYRDSLQGVKLPTTLDDETQDVSGRVRKHHQWLVLSRQHAVDVISYGETGLRRHFKALVRTSLHKSMDPAILGANDETFVATALLSAFEDRGLATYDSLEELNRQGVKSECTTFVYWRHCFKQTALGAEAGWNNSAYKEMRQLAAATGWETSWEQWFDSRKSPAKALNDSPRNFGFKNSAPNTDYLKALVGSGLLFARKFGLDEDDQLSSDLSQTLPSLWKEWEKQHGPWTRVKLMRESKAWPVLDMGDDRARNTAYHRIPKVSPTSRCCCRGPNANDCVLLYSDQLVRSLNPLRIVQFVCDGNDGWHSYDRHYGMTKLPPACVGGGDGGGGD